MRMAIIADPENVSPGSELHQEIEFINAGQQKYHLVAFSSEDLRATATQKARQFDAVLLIDNEMMAGAVPKYNEFLGV